MVTIAIQTAWLLLMVLGLVTAVRWIHNTLGEPANVNDESCDCDPWCPSHTHEVWDELEDLGRGNFEGYPTLDPRDPDKLAYDA